MDVPRPCYRSGLGSYEPSEPFTSEVQRDGKLAANLKSRARYWRITRGT